jgi:2-methylcitrate dehydratase PrpD
MEFPKIVVSYIESLGGTPEATIFHTKRKFPAIHAALANGTCAHAIDMDDGHRYAAHHPGVAIIPAALAATELTGASTKQMVAGIVVGYEIMIRLGMAINPSSLNRGFHATGITGVFGAAAAVAKILNLNHEETIGAFGMAGLQASGLLQTNHDVEGAKVKSLTPGRAAQGGLLSCILARKGARGPTEIFEGEDGFFKAVTDDVKTNLLTQGLGKEFEILNTYVKLYAACRHAHACIDAALAALQGNPVEISAIDKILVETYPAAIRLAGIREVATPSAARFSIPFTIALALVTEDAGADKYCEENIRDKRIQDLSKKVEFSVGTKWEKLYPNKRGATVRIRAKEGREWSAEVELAKGEPENPATWDDVCKKFYRNAAFILQEIDARKLFDSLVNLENLTINDFVKLI